MNNLEYSKELNTFAYEFNKLDFTQYISSETKTRIVISKLYYSLLHYYFTRYPEIALSNTGQKHTKILNEISDEAEKRLFKKLKSYREWADYRPLESSPFSINLLPLFHQVHRKINS